MDLIIEKSIKVILSCQTKEQWNVAKEFAKLACDQYKGVDRIGKAFIPIDRALFLKYYQLRQIP